MSIQRAPFGIAPTGESIELFMLKNAAGMEARVTNWGAYLTYLSAPDRAGHFGDITLGYDDLAGYVNDKCCFGGVCGRFANRIAKARFDLDGKTYHLAANNGPNHLHGGVQGFHKRVWQAEVAGDAVRMTYTSPDGEENYPGTLTASVTYSLGEDNVLTLAYEAETDAPTPVNLTNHAYFNLRGPGQGDILDHEVQIFADEFTPVDETFIPTGEIRTVADTPFDFREPKRIADGINADDEQIRFGLGYDHNWVIRRAAPGMALAARVREASTGRILEVSTTAPGVQCYCGNFLDGSAVGKGGAVFKKRYGLCFETQHFPDSPNHENFPSAILRPGERYTHTTLFAVKSE